MFGNNEVISKKACNQILRKIRCKKLLKQNLKNQSIKIDTIKKLDKNIQSSKGLGVVYVALTSVNPMFLILGIIFIGRTIFLEQKRKRVLKNRRDEV
ncbi:MAG: hypothetical protein ACW964_08780 [Candidatus Hodarchaeales archaeon]|jgi:hypothetical protein